MTETRGLRVKTLLADWKQCCFHEAAAGDAGGGGETWQWSMAKPEIFFYPRLQTNKYKLFFNINY